MPTEPYGQHLRYSALKMSTMFNPHSAPLVTTSCGSTSEEDTITGCFTNGHRRTHTFEAGAGRAHPIKDGNFWFVDAAHIAATLSDWTPGGELVWKIPVGWHRRGVSEDMFYVFQPDYEQWRKEDSRQLKILPVYSQRFHIGFDGVFRVDKFGHWTSRSQSCRVVLDGETLQWSHPQ